MQGRNVYLTMVYIKQRLEVSVLDTLQVEERVLVRVAPENVSKEGATGRENYFVSLNLLIITS